MGSPPSTPCRRPEESSSPAARRIADRAPPWTASSPCRAWESPLPHRAGIPRVKHVKLSPHPLVGRVSGSRVRDPPNQIRDPDDEEGAILEFFGQLWFIPESSPKQPWVRSGKGGDERDYLVWIKKSLWENNSFTPEDCFPVGAADVWSKPPEKLSFAKRIWGRGEK